MNLLLPVRSRAFNWYPVALTAAFALFLWMQMRHHRSAEEHDYLQNLLSSVFHTAKGDAQQAFENGDFERAAQLLGSVGSTTGNDHESLLLQARALECQCNFPQAGEIYARLENMPGNHFAAMRGHAFCKRMASERHAPGAPSREVLYRLHEELMRRHDAVSARLIGKKLLPDPRPLRDSLFALLTQLDNHIQLVTHAEDGSVDVTVFRWQPQMVELLKDLRIGTLTLAQSGIEDARALAGLDVRVVNLSDNQLGDLSALRALPLRQLHLDYTNVADVRPLAGMPLQELHLAHTLVSSVRSLALCPLHKLDLSGTAVRDLEPLRGMELRELNLSHTRVSDLSALTGMPLERLVLNGTEVHDLRPLAGARLKTLSLADTAVKDLDALAGMPLVELDLRGCELLTDVQAVARCSQLERIYLPRHLQAPADHWQLPRLRFIEYERHSQASLARQ